MIDIDPSLDRSTEISILGLELLGSPEALQGFGVLSMGKKNWQTVLPKRVMLVSEMSFNQVIPVVLDY